MGLAGCYAILKYLVFFINLIFWISGFSIIVLSIWMIIDEAFYISMAQDVKDYYYGVYVFLIIGIFLFTVGFLGCFGTLRESQCMLVLFFCLLLLVLVAEISAACWAHSNSYKLEKLVRENVEYTVFQQYNVVPSRTATFNAIQRELHCCGANGPSDWMNSKLNTAASKRVVDLTIHSNPQNYKLPESCCDSKTDLYVCQSQNSFEVGAPILPPWYTEGCSNKLVNILKDYMNTVVLIGICVAICQILGLIFSLILCCGIQQRNRYKS